MNVPENLLYATSHEWIENSGEIRSVGITDHAQHELTDVVYVELPRPGRSVAAGEIVCVVESVKTASDIYAPAAGELVEVNDAVVDDPSLINSDPYGAGWLFKLRFEGGQTLTLLSAEDYGKLIS